MTRKERQQTLLQGGVLASDALSGGPATAGTGVTIDGNKDEALTLRRVVLDLSGFLVSVTAALDYGGTKLCDLPDSNLMIMACEVDLELVKDGTGITDATDINMGVGTAVASNATLSGAMQDVLDVEAFTPTDLSPAYDRHSADNSTTVHPTQLADGASNALYLNCAATLSGDGSLTVSGTVTLYYLDLGNVTS